MASAEALSRRDWLIASCALLLLFVAASGGSAWRKPVDQGFDEVAHVSYASSLQRQPAWPDLEALRMLDPASFAVTAEPNYLNHPPVYYAVMAALGPRITDHPGSLFALRAINIALVGAGLVALLTLGWRLGLTRDAFYGFAVFIAATPVLAPLAGSVNNDNLGFTGGCLALLGLQRYLTRPSRSALLLACAGLLIAAAAKLTGLLLIGGTVALALMIAASRRRISFEPLAMAAVALVIASLPYLAFDLQYGSPAPDTSAQHALLTTGAEIAGWSQQPRLSPAAYVLFFLKSFGSGWLPTLAPLSAFQTALLALPALLAALSLAGAVVAVRALAMRHQRPCDAMIVAGMAAILATLAVHIAFSYQRHLATGWMMDAYPRYYLPLLAIVPMAVLRFAASCTDRIRRAITVFLIGAPIAFMLLQVIYV